MSAEDRDQTGNEPRPAVFIDKDGTLIRNVSYNVDPRKVVFTDGALAGLQLLADAGFALIVVTNQPGIALRRFTRAAFDALAHAIADRLADAGVALAGFYFCPHLPPPSPTARTSCSCRMPAPGLLQRAAKELNIALARSWMMGDQLEDVETGARAGCRTVLLDIGTETEWRFSPLRTPTLRAHNFRQAARAIVANGGVTVGEQEIAGT